MEPADTVLPIGSTLSQPRTVLVLGGGGMKGIAHIGVWKALEESGVRPDAIIGTSIGALIGSCLAVGMGWRELADIARSLTRDDIVSINKRSVWLGGVRESSVFEGPHFMGYIRRMLPAKEFAQLKVPLRINAVSLVSGEEVWFGTGMRQDLSLAEAVYASCALPIYFPPLVVGEEDYLVDGGVLDVLPVKRAVEWGAERVIAVDVGSDLLPPDPGFFDRGMVAIHDRVLNINLQQQRKTCMEGVVTPTLYIRPKIGHLHAFDFERTQFFLEEGYRAAREAIASAEAA